jgi:hypothetical protein
MAQCRCAPCYSLEISLGGLIWFENSYSVRLKVPNGVYSASVLIYKYVRIVTPKKMSNSRPEGSLLPSLRLGNNVPSWAIRVIPCQSGKT